MGTIELAFFPNKFEAGAKLYRTDEKKLYKNDGSFSVPSFLEIGGGGSPSGTISMFGGINSAIPIGWVRCDGASYTTAAQADLFAAIAYKWGGSGANFNVPNFETNNIFPRAAHQDAEVAASGGESTHVLTVAELALHNHVGGAHTHSLGTFGQTNGSNAGHTTTGNAAVPQNTGSGGAVATTSAGSDAAHENKPPYISVYYIIKL